MSFPVKHALWASCAVACVAIMAHKHWTPLSVRIDYTGAMQVAAPSVAAIPATPATPAPALVPVPQAAEDARLVAQARELLRGQVGTPQAGTLPVAPAQPQAAQASNAGAIEDVEVAGKVMANLEKMEAVADYREGTDVKKIVTVFFDPRCPYCHNAFKAMRGKIAARYIPVLALGSNDEGRDMALSILSAKDRVDAMMKVMDSKTPLGPVAQSPSYVEKLNENFQSFASIFAAAPNLRPGVPTFFIPRADGRLVIMVGYEPGDEMKIAAIMGGA